jgi:hypothetical protein
MIADQDPDSLLGITDRMDAAAIESLLDDGYRKWNSRVNRSDQKVCEPASQMLPLVAGARRRHIGSTLGAAAHAHPRHRPVARADRPLPRRGPRAVGAASRRARPPFEPPRLAGVRRSA